MSPKRSNAMPIARAPDTTSVRIGVFTKRDAAHLIVNGCHHLHSTTLAQRDACVQRTREAIHTAEIPTYPWEVNDTIGVCQLTNSSERASLIESIVDNLGLKTKRSTSATVQSVLEELVSNAIFHPYINKDGTSKYPRHKAAELSTNEFITIRFAAQPSGIFLSVADQGGTIDFEKVAESFKRCYGSPNEQIENKESGAGLGIYMVFEAATHVKVVTSPGKQTEVTCWLSDKKHFDPENFSFNYFERRA